MSGRHALYWPGGARPRERPVVYFAFWGVFVGGLVAGCAIHAIWMVLSLAAMVGLVVFHSLRDRDTVEQLAEQLERRPSFPADAWGSDDRAAFAAAVGRIIADEVGWPNWHFLPEDPMEIVLYCPAGDGGEGLAIQDNFEKTFGREFDFPEVKTFGEFIDRNLTPGAAWGARASRSTSPAP